MNNAPAKINLMSEEQIKTLAQAGVIPADTPPPIVKVFAIACQHHNLSPFKKEIYLVRYGTQYNTIVGIDGLRTKASRTGQFAGRDDARFDLQPDGRFHTAAQIKAAGKLPVSCTVTIYRMINGQRCPFSKTIVFAEYCPERPSNKWLAMPFNMIEKCAEAAVLRMAFSDETAGLHIEEEQHAFEDNTMSAAVHRQALDHERDKWANLIDIRMQQVRGLTDQQETNILSALRDESTPIDTLKNIYHSLEKFMDEDDPARQFGQRENAMNGTSKKVTTPSK